MLPFDPKKPLYGFTMRAPHAKRRIHLFEDEEKVSVLFRPKNAPPDWLGAFFQSDIYYIGLQHRMRRRGKGAEIDFRHKIEQNLFFRVFHLADPREDEQRTWRILWGPILRMQFLWGIPSRLVKFVVPSFGREKSIATLAYGVHLLLLSNSILRANGMMKTAMCA